MIIKPAQRKLLFNILADISKGMYLGSFAFPAVTNFKHVFLSISFTLIAACYVILAMYFVIPEEKYDS